MKLLQDHMSKAGTQKARAVRTAGFDTGPRACGQIRGEIMTVNAWYTDRYEEYS